MEAQYYSAAPDWGQIESGIEGWHYCSNRLFYSLPEPATALLLRMDIVSCTKWIG
jgi:hypothetical protein